MEANMSAYHPYGEEWQAEMMKIPKKHLVEMLKEALQSDKENAEFLKYLNQIKELETQKNRKNNVHIPKLS
jgi:hypothetical protein